MDVVADSGAVTGGVVGGRTLPQASLADRDDVATPDGPGDPVARLEYFQDRVGSPNSTTPFHKGVPDRVAL